jgi:hypothetical protein
LPGDVSIQVVFPLDEVEDKFVDFGLSDKLFDVPLFEHDKTGLGHLAVYVILEAIVKWL